ncbi:MAG TPA: condensation domain-containing protein [Edaphobacter sp.]|nr:condensation domain-containing protein [Edaphobacter sp.]
MDLRVSIDLAPTRSYFSRRNINHAERSPTPAQHMRAFFWLHNQIEPVHFAVAAQVEGAIAIDAWKAGLSALQHRHPLLMASIKADANTAPCFLSNPGIPIPSRVVEGNALQRLEAEVATELATPFRDGDPLLVRAVLLHEKQRSIMVLVAHHSIADGPSLAYAIRDLLQLLSGETLSPLPIPPSHESLLGLEEEAGVGESRGKFFGTIAPLNPRFQELAPRVESLGIMPELTGKLQEFARQEHTSMHGALASSVVFAVRKLISVEARLRCVWPPLSAQENSSIRATIVWCSPTLGYWS